MKTVSETSKITLNAKKKMFKLQDFQKKKSKRKCMRK